MPSEGSAAAAAAEGVCVEMVVRRRRCLGKQLTFLLGDSPTLVELVPGAFPAAWRRSGGGEGLPSQIQLVLDTSVLGDDFAGEAKLQMYLKQMDMLSGQQRLLACQLHDSIQPLLAPADPPTPSQPKE